jgi:DNA-binding FadR family transcriptional regulator
MPDHRLARVTLLDGLVDGLAQQIQTGELPPGAQLPGEAALGEQWGVSRPVVREALALLRDRGYVHTVNGSGTFVRHPDASHVSAVLERHMMLTERDVLTVDHLYEARTAIEVTSARLAASRADEDDWAELRRHLDDMHRYRDDKALYAAADVGFHIALARASKNPLLPTLLTPLVRTIVEGVMESHRSPRGVTLGLKGHGMILEFVEAREADIAAEAMVKHLRDSRKIFPPDVLLRLSVPSRVISGDTLETSS